jgi:hypothetical protein
MADKKQRNVNREVRLFNKGFAKDIAPYNTYELRQEKRLGRDWDSYWVLTIYKDGVGIRTKMFEYYDIVSSSGKARVARELFWFVNNTVAQTVNGAAKDFTKN